MRRLLLIATVLISTITYGKSQPPFQLSFGSGGGFTGVYNTYTLSEEGKLYKQNSATKSNDQITKLKKKDIKEVEALISKFDYAHTTVNTPGNMSSFVNLTKDGKAYNNIWSGTNSGNADLDILYQKLNSFIPNK
jgi:hypothetical protein